VIFVVEFETYITSPEIFRQKAEVLKALAHPERLCIVRGLIRQEGLNVSRLQSCLEKPQSTMSQHLAKLRAAGIIEGERQGLEVYYRVISAEARNVVEALFK
jgi:ArsR family transcriptional regulator